MDRRATVVLKFSMKLTYPQKVFAALYISSRDRE